MGWSYNKYYSGRLVSFLKYTKTNNYEEATGPNSADLELSESEDDSWDTMSGGCTGSEINNNVSLPHRATIKPAGNCSSCPVLAVARWIPFVQREVVGRKRASWTVGNNRNSSGEQATKAH